MRFWIQLLLFFISEASVAQQVGAQQTAQQTAQQGTQQPASSTASKTPLRIYIAPTTGWTTGGSLRVGYDGNPGTAAQPIATLRQAQRIIRNFIRAGKNLRPVEIRIAPRTYYNQEIEWSVSMDQHLITMMPWYDDGNRPIFDGSTIRNPCRPAVANCTASSQYYGGGTFMKFIGTNNSLVNVRMKHIKIQYYGAGVVIDEARGVKLYGLYFWRLGNEYQPNMVGTTAALSITDGSTNNEVTNSHFIEISNTDNPHFTYQSGSIHAIYISHSSHKNNISGNRFGSISGDAVRIKDFCNENNIVGNTFTGLAGLYANASHYFTATGSCPSFFTRFKDNVIYGSPNAVPGQNAGLWGCSAYHSGAQYGFRTYPLNSINDMPDGCPLPEWNGPGLPPQHWSLTSNQFIEVPCPLP